MKSWVCARKYYNEFSSSKTWDQQTKRTCPATLMPATKSPLLLGSTSTNQNMVEGRLRLEHLLLHTELSIGKMGAQEGTRGQKCPLVIKGHSTPAMPYKKGTQSETDDSHSWQVTALYWICCQCLAAVHRCCQGNRRQLDGNKDQQKLSLTSFPPIPTAISMVTAAASQRQRGYHSLVNVRCGYQPVRFRYHDTNSTRMLLPTNPDSLLTLQQESSVFESIYKCWAWIFIRKRKFTILPFKAKAGLISCPTKAKPGEVTKEPWIFPSAFDLTHMASMFKKRNIQLCGQIFHILAYSNQRQAQLNYVSIIFLQVVIKDACLEFRAAWSSSSLITQRKMYFFNCMIFRESYTLFFISTLDFYVPSQSAGQDTELSHELSTIWFCDIVAPSHIGSPVILLPNNTSFKAVSNPTTLLRCRCAREVCIGRNSSVHFQSVDAGKVLNESKI